jgi:hypothetical protein
VGLSQYIDGDATKLDKVINIVSLRLSSAVDMVVGQNGQNMVVYIQRGEGVRGVG